MDLLRDAIWEFVWGAIGLIVTVLLFQKERQRKALSYHILEDQPVVTLDKAAQSHVRVLFRGRNVSHLRRSKIRLINVGNTQILPSDYFEPLTLTFGKYTRVMQAEVNDSNPPGLDALVEIDAKHPNRVVLNPLFLQEGEHITVDILVSGTPGPLEVRARISDIRRVTNYLRSESYGWYVRQLRGREFKGLLRAWSILPAFTGVMGIMGMIRVSNGSWLWPWLILTAVWYVLLALLVSLLFASVPLVIRPLKRKLSSR